MTHLSLCTGIGGIDIAADWAGFRSICQVEVDSFCRKILKETFNVPIYDDIRSFSYEVFKKLTGEETVTLISAGFPCQPHTYAGKRRGKEDDRWLWPEVHRVVDEIKPDFFLAENVPGILSSGSGSVIEQIYTDLGNSGYEILPILIPAAATGAKQIRERLFLVSMLTRVRLQQRSVTQRNQNTSSGFQRKERPEQKTSFEPCLVCMVNEVPDRKNWIHALGNMVDPYQVYPILKAIYDTMEGYNV